LWSIYNVQDLDELKILEIERPDLKSCPSPDESIIDWVEGEWKNLDIETITYKEKIVKKVKDEEGIITEYEEHFTEDENRVNIFENWVKNVKIGDLRNFLRK